MYSMKILIVDDEFVSRKKARKILAGFGECDVAVNGNEAREAFVEAHEEGLPYDLITMDIEMPEMDGITTLKAIRDWEESKGIMPGRGVKVIMLTAFKDARSVLPSFNQGCEAYIVKPFDREKLEKALNSI